MSSYSLMGNAFIQMHTLFAQILLCKSQWDFCYKFVICKCYGFISSNINTE